MADTFTKEQRTEIMRKVKSSHNKSTELKLIHFFKVNNIKGWRRNYKLIGKPDIVFPKQRTILFLDGCFWHGHNCRNTKPKDNEAYWTLKIARNKERDSKVTQELISKNWKVLRIWECELKNYTKLYEILKSNSLYIEDNK